MSELDPFESDDFFEDESVKAEAKLRCAELQDRCKAANIPFEETEIFDDDVSARIAIKSGREQRWVNCYSNDDFVRLLNVSFEHYTFLNGLDAICAYDKGEIEALVRPVGSLASPQVAFSRAFGIEIQNIGDLWPNFSVTVMSAGVVPITTVTLSKPTKELCALLDNNSKFSLSIKIKSEGVSQHDQAVAILKKISDALFFQIDLLTDVPLSIVRDRSGSRARPRKRRHKPRVQIKYPNAEYDSAPISLYWYARSANGMPLLQFLAYYQVIEFYYPIYSQAEARRRLKSILKDPTFRGDRDADIGRVLSAIQITRSGTVGDERSQLKATFSECIDPDALRDFLVRDSERAEFLSSKTKGLTDHKLPLSAPNVDLRNDVAERIYEIRCKIVHTKTDARNSDFELLLPFSKEAEQLHFDIELVQYLAQQILVSASASI